MTVAAPKIERKRNSARAAARGFRGFPGKRFRSRIGVYGTGGLKGAKYPWGDDPPSGRANYRHPFEGGAGWVKYLVKPGMFPPNRFGLNDMAGNVWEWCADWDGGYSDGPSVNPPGSPSGTMRIVRGGGWNSNDLAVRTAIRGGNDPATRGSHIGFRIARGGKGG